MPIYPPLPTSGRLHLKLGYVGSCTMTAGSATATIQSFPNGPAPSNSDVGTQVSVIGAGASPPFIPTYPQDPNNPTAKTPYPGTLLVTKLVSQSSGGTVLQLRDAALNSTQPGAANFTLYREVSTDINNAMKVQATLTTSCRATLTATIFDPLGSLNVRVGMPVLLYDDVNGGDGTDGSSRAYFGGSIDTVKARNIPGRVPNPNPIYWDISCVSWSQLLDRRLINAYIPPPVKNQDGTLNPCNPLQAPPRLPPPAVPADANYGCAQPGQFINMTAGDIVNMLIFNYCESEGLSTNLGNNVGALVAFFQANPGQDTIAQAIDNAAQAGSDLTDSYVWWIDAWKKVFFVRATSILSPWNIDETSSDPNQNDASVLLEVNIETTREKLCNDVYMDSSQTIGAPTTERYLGDGSAHSYSVGRPIGDAPVVYLNTTNGRFLQRMAVKGAPQFTADLYWAQGDNSIEQEKLTIVANPAGLNSSDTKFLIGYPLQQNMDNKGYMIQIDNEWMELIRSYSVGTAPNIQYYMEVMRNRPVRGVLNSGDLTHTMGATIYPMAPLTGKKESIDVTYSPITKQMFTAQNDTSIQNRYSIESGTGKWQTKVSLSYPFKDLSVDKSGASSPTGPGHQLALAFVTDYGDPPAAFSGETYRYGLQIGQMIFINLLRPPINGGKGENFLIDQIDFSTEDKRQKWSFHGINGTLIGDWRKAFLGLSSQALLAGGGAQNIATPGPIGSPIWNPGGAFPITGDPMFSASSFGISQDYVGGADGKPLPELTVTGNQTFDSSGASIPILWKVRREFVSGSIAQVGVVSPDNPGHIVLGGSPPANLWNGRIISKLANRYGDNQEVPLRDFTIVSSDNNGDFIVTPDPSSNGCQTGDLFTIRTGRVQGTPAMPGSDAVVTPTSYSDPTWSNIYNNFGSYTGLMPNGNVGNIVLVISGTGAFQEPQVITANDMTSITISPGWTTMPDYTSCIVIVDTTPPEVHPQSVGSANTVEAILPVRNYNGMVVRVEAYLDPQSIMEGLLETATMRETYIWGAQSSRVIYYGDKLGMFVQDHTLIFDTSLVPAPATMTLQQDMGIDPKADNIVKLNAIYKPPNGTVINVDGADGSERMYVVSGAGTDTLTVNRAWIGGGPIVAHSVGDTVHIPGAFSWTIIPYSAVPNQEFIFVKAWWSSDINYVILYAAPTDPNGAMNELPDGEPYHVLGDISSTNGVYSFKVPQV